MEESIYDGIFDYLSNNEVDDIDSNHFIQSIERLIDSIEIKMALNKKVDEELNKLELLAEEKEEMRKTLFEKYYSVDLRTYKNTGINREEIFEKYMLGICNIIRGKI